MSLMKIINQNNFRSRANITYSRDLSVATRTIPSFWSRPLKTFLKVLDH